MLKKIKIIAVALCISLTINAQEHKNPFGLVYHGAITKNEKGKVNIHPVNYLRKDGIKVSANVYTPAHYDASKKYPAIVVAHPNGGVKEQASGLYAQRLAELGYITIAADAAYQGASSGQPGQPRNYDAPHNRVEDIHAMIDFISKYQGVDIERIAGFGICGGAGYMYAAAQSDKRLKAVATLSLLNSGRVRRNGLLDADMNTIQERLKKASQARQQEVLSGEVSYERKPNPPLSKEQILAQMEKLKPNSLAREMLEYYHITHTHPNSFLWYSTASLMDLMPYDVTSFGELINQPLLMMAGSNADTLYMSYDAFAKATTTQNKELYIIEGATHIQTYWKPEYVEEVIGKLKDFFEKSVVSHDR